MLLQADPDPTLRLKELAALWEQRLVTADEFIKLKQGMLAKPS